LGDNSATSITEWPNNVTFIERDTKGLSPQLLEIGLEPAKKCTCTHILQSEWAPSDKERRE